MVWFWGWYLDEKNLLYEGELMSGVLVDFGFYFFYNVKVLVVCGSGFYFYFFKLESYQEVWLWNDVFVFV